MKAVGVFFLLLLFLVILPAFSWAFYVRWRAHRAGESAPPLSAYNPFAHRQQSNYPIAPRPSGPLSWIQDKIASLKNARSSGGGYENTRRSTRLDPDGAWDDRVGAEADASYGRAGGGFGGGYEEQELGLHPGSGSYGGSGYGEHVMPEYGEARGRSRSRDDLSHIGGGQKGLDQRYDHETGRENPFGEGAESSDLRGVSPRPVEMDGSEQGHRKSGSGDTHTSGRADRKSMFHEEAM